MPARKSGLWEMDNRMEGMPSQGPMQICIDQNADNLVEPRRHPADQAKPDCSGWLDAFQQFRDTHFPRRTLVFGLLAVAYLAAIQWVSFYVSTFLFLVLSIVYLRKGRVLNAILIAAVLLVLIYLLFSLAFSVYLP